MAEGIVRELWDALYEVVGEDLRVVTRYDGVEYETTMREDVRDQYTAGEDREIVDDTVVKQIGLRETESAFETGDLEAVVRVFEDAWVAAVPDDVDAKAGVIVSVGRGRAATMDDVDACIRTVRDRTAGRDD